MKPSELYPALADDRLIIVADILRRCRNSAASDAKRDLGETGLTIGIAAFEQTRHALAVASKDLYPWLKVKVVDRHLIIEIGGIPTRYFPSTSGDEVPERTLEIGEGEKEQIEMAFGTVGMHPDVRCLRFEVLKKSDHSTENVTFVFVGKDGSRFHEWLIPQSSTRRKRSMRQTAATAINLEMPSVEVRPELGA